MLHATPTLKPSQACHLLVTVKLCFSGCQLLLQLGNPVTHAFDFSCSHESSIGSLVDSSGW